MKVKSQQVKKEILKTLELEKPENSNLDTDDEDDQISLDSDQELQLAFARKELKPGLNIQLDKPKQYVNDEAGLERKLKDFYLKMDWIERMDITVPKILVQVNTNQETDKDTTKEFVDNDFKRESYFLKQAESAVQMALPRLKGFGVLTKRPDDYFAEMSKSDNHMKKVRETLLTKHAEIEKRDKIRKLRELKKMGKQIQIENEKKKQQGKKVYKSEKHFIDTENGESNGKKQKKDGKPDKKNKVARKKASFKNDKFGFGGRKKRGKYNTAESYAEAYNNPVNKKKKSSMGSKKTNTKTKSKFTNKNKPKKFSKK